MGPDCPGVAVVRSGSCCQIRSHGPHQPFSQSATHCFFSELAKLLSSHGWITLNQLRAGDQPIAWLYAFRFARHWSFYQMTFDCSFSGYSPGSGLRLKVIEEACDSSDTDFVDLGLGGEHHKKRWATGTRETLNVTLARSTMTYLRVAARYHAAAAIKTSPRLEHYVRRMLGRPSTGNALA